MSSTATCHNLCPISRCSVLPWVKKSIPMTVSVLTHGMRLERVRISSIRANVRKSGGKGNYGMLCPRAMAGSDEISEDEEGGIVSKERKTIQALEALGRGRKGKRQSDASDDDGEDDSFYERPKKKKTWDEMSGQEQLMEAWMGEKGGLYWLNRLSWGAIILIIICWILFRFVGPQLGFYELESPLVPKS